MNNIQMIRATPKEASLLAELGRATFLETFAKDNRPEDMELYLSETYNVERQLSEILDPKRIIEIAWVENQAAGFLHLLKGSPDPSVTGEKPMEILRLYADSCWHGKGVGTVLMQRALQIAREEGFQTLWLGVWEHNYRAQAFYKKHGFQIVGQHDFHLGKDVQMDLIMTRSI